jgi:hypothetical protein
MLTKFAVESFKSLENVEIELGHVNVFIGANGSGKSNILEAIGLLGAAANGRVDEEALLRRGVRPSLPAFYVSSFKNREMPPYIRLTAENDGASFSADLRSPFENPGSDWSFIAETLLEGGDRLVERSPESKINLKPTAGYTALKSVELLADRPASRLLDELQQFTIYSPDTATLRGLDIDPQQREPVGLSGGKLIEATDATFLSQLDNEMYDSVLRLIGWAKRISATAFPKSVESQMPPRTERILRFQDGYMADGRNELTALDVSEGALYVLLMTVLVHHPSVPPILAVDNFDHALNPRLARALTRQICDWVVLQQNRQLLLTSHNPSVLDGLPLQDDRIRLFTVERSYYGKTVVKRVMVDEKLLKEAENGVPLSQQWVMGTFGGVPKI